MVTYPSKAGETANDGVKLTSLRKRLMQNWSRRESPQRGLAPERTNIRLGHSCLILVGANALACAANWFASIGLRMKSNQTERDCRENTALLSTRSYRQSDIQLRKKAKLAGFGQTRKLSEAYIEDGLRDAIRSGFDQFHLVFQPIFHIRTGRTSGVEALLRWSHPLHGPISPSMFIAAAEEAGLIEPITQWVLQEACRSYASLLKAVPSHLQPAFLSINCSARVLQSEQMARRILNCLFEHNVAASRFAVEVTESLIARPTPPILLALDWLRAEGVQVLLDDFGAGYSSLSSLKDLPIDVIKIDRAFFRHLNRSRTARIIVQSIVDLAAALEKEVICEGVESLEQLEILAVMGDFCAQGFLLSRPLTLDRLIASLKAPSLDRDSEIARVWFS